MRQILTDTALGLTKEQARDHETTDDEEHVDADVATLETRNRGVDQDDQDDRDGAKPLDVGP